MSQLRQAVALYESFRERKPHHRLAKLKVDVPKIAVCMGYTDSIDYTTDHAGKLRLYRHKFAKGSRPLLCVSPSGQQLLLLGGRYKWDRRGIVDRDATGKEIIPPHHARINPSVRERTKHIGRALVRAATGADLAFSHRGYVVKPVHFKGFPWGIHRDGKFVLGASGPENAKRGIAYLIERSRRKS